MTPSPHPEDSSPGLEVRPATPADDAAVLALLEASMGWVPDDQHHRFFEWKHRQSPFGASPAWVACDGDRIVGFRTFLRWQFVRGGEAVEAVRAVDTATHPDYQGRGIFSLLTRRALTDLADEGVEFVFNTPNDRSRPGYLKMGWQLVGRLPVAFRPRSPGALVRLARARTPADKWSAESDAGLPATEAFADQAAVTTLLAGVTGAGSGAAPAGASPNPTASPVADGGADARSLDRETDTGRTGAARTPETSAGRAGSTGTPETDTGRTESAGTLEANRPAGAAVGDTGEGRLVTHRSPGYLRWRYRFPPLHYRVIAGPGGPSDGLVVFRLRRRGAATEAAICELLLPDEPTTGRLAARDDRRGVARPPTRHRRLARHLLRQVLRETRADHAVWLGPARWDLGLLPLPKQGPTLVWRPTGTVDGTVPAAPPLPEWGLTLGDIELF